MHPLNQVVADVHGVGVFGQQLHSECVAIAGGFKSLVPPARAFEQRRADGLRRAAVEVVDDGLDGIAHGRAGVLFLQTMPGDEVFFERVAERRGEVAEGFAEVPGARIEEARLVAGARKLDQGMMLADGDRLRRWRHLTNVIARFALGHREGERRFHFGVLREAFGTGQIDGGARSVDVISALFGFAQGLGYAVRVVKEKCRGIHQHAAIVFGLGLEAPQHGTGEGFLHRAALIGVGGVSAEGRMHFHQQDLRAATLEADQARTAGLSAVEADVVRSNARGKRIDVKKVGVEAGDFHPQLAGLGLPIEGNEAVQFVVASGFGGDGGNGFVLGEGGQRQEE